MVVGLPGVQDPLDQAALLEQLGAQVDWSGSGGCTLPSTLPGPSGLSRQASRWPGGEHHVEHSQVSRKEETCHVKDTCTWMQKVQNPRKGSPFLRALLSHRGGRAAHLSHVTVRKASAGGGGAPRMACLSVSVYVVWVGLGTKQHERHWLDSRGSPWCSRGGRQQPGGSPSPHSQLEAPPCSRAHRLRPCPPGQRGRE